MKTLHCHLGVRDALRWPDRRLRGLLQDGDGRQLSPDQAREALMEELSRGNEVLMFGDCNDFDPKSGCRGHVS